jgi:hypothetical protein
MSNSSNRRQSLAGALYTVVCLTGLFAAPVCAHAGAVDAYYERAVMSDADQRCRLFTPELGAALGAAEAQAHGAALRSGMTNADLDRVGQRAWAAAGSVACNSHDIALAAGRVRTAFDGYSRMQTMRFAGDTSAWQADRAVSANLTRWQLSQSQPFGWDKLTFGIAGRGGQMALVAVASFADGARPYAARLVMRDSGRAPEPFLNIIRASSNGRLPLDARMPPSGATRSWFPQDRQTADASLLHGASSGVAFRFPPAASDAIARLDPRESIAIEFLFAGPNNGSGGGGDVIRTAYIEVGDYAAGRAFLASAQK